MGIEISRLIAAEKESARILSEADGQARRIRQDSEHDIEHLQSMTEREVAAFRPRFEAELDAELRELEAASCKRIEEARSRIRSLAGERREQAARDMALGIIEP
ncbi:MAG: hypothetical protein FJ224_04490 [Lentisphaerae bacterium]|nr:hypothetical protein [Lentisphaerota bacterium]